MSSDAGFVIRRDIVLCYPRVLSLPHYLSCQTVCVCPRVCRLLLFIYLSPLVCVPRGVYMLYPPRA